jgi:hypothetical protein
MIRSRRKALRSVGTVRNNPAESNLQDILWRLDRLERQVKTLSELVRDHAEDADRLVRIVGEDHEALRRQLLREHEETLRSRKRARAAVSRIVSAKVGVNR